MNEVIKVAASPQYIGIEFICNIAVEVTLGRRRRRRDGRWLACADERADAQDALLASVPLYR